MAIHSKLSTLLGERRLKMSDIIREADVSRTAVQGLYYDKVKKVDYRVINNICNYLGCRLEELLEYTPDPPKEKARTE